jgi:hypothetical protein
MVNFVALG